MTKPPERILAWTVNDWGSAWAVAPEDAAPDATEYIRADLATQPTPDPAVTVGVKDFDVKVVRGNTGGNLALYFNDHRVAGSKPWGGGTTIHEFRVQGDDAKSAGILSTIRNFQTVPPVKECLTTDAPDPAVQALVEALREARVYVPDHHGPIAAKIDAALAAFDKTSPETKGE